MPALPHDTALTHARIAWFGLPALLLLTVLAYGNSFAGVWQFDDHAVLLADPRVQSLAAWWHSLPHLRPVFKLSVALQHQVDAGLFGFHLFNLVLHLANTLLLFRLLRALPLPALRKSPGLVLLITAVFALHPAQTEVVTYLSGRSVALEAFGLLLALNVWQRWLSQGGRARLLWLLPALGIALGSRESAVIAPLWLAWLWHDNRGGSRRLLWLALVAATALLVAVLMLPRYRELLWLALQWQGVDQLLAVQTQAIAHLFAVALGAAPLNADPVLTVTPLTSGSGMICALAVFVLLVLAWRHRRQRSLLWVAVSWLVLSWLPTHSVFVRFDPVNDRQLYLALPGIALLLCWSVLAVANLSFAAANRFSRKRFSQTPSPSTPASPERSSAKLPSAWRGWMMPLLAIALSLTLAMATQARNTVYHSEIRFWQDVVTKAPSNARGWNNLGIAYQQAGRLPAAEQAFEQALALRPDYQRAAVNLRLLRRQQSPSP
ncbi:MAG TPA: tetratricopeptide repeat protein [Permianibacter sp.]|nr:tetratricopeptide repeat protein [Permianibacter sp.]